MRWAWLFVLGVLLFGGVTAQTELELSKRQETTWKHLSAFYFKIGIRAHFKPSHTYFFVGMIDSLYQMIASEMQGYVRETHAMLPVDDAVFVDAQRQMKWVARLFSATSNQPFIHVDEKYILDLFPPPIPMKRRVARAWTMQFVQVSFLMLDFETDIAAHYEIHRETPGEAFAGNIFCRVFDFNCARLKDEQTRIKNYVSAAGVEANAYLQMIYEQQGMRLPKQRAPKFSRRHLAGE